MGNKFGNGGDWEVARVNVGKLKGAPGVCDLVFRYPLRVQTVSLQKRNPTALLQSDSKCNWSTDR